MAQLPHGIADRAARHLAEQERTLRGMLRAGAIVLAGLTILSAMAHGPAHALWVYGAGVALHVGHLAALRTGRTRLVAQSHCILYLVWITAVLALDSGGLRAPAALVYPPIVLLTGLVWSGRAAVGMALAVSACGGALVLLERQGALPALRAPVTPVELWMILTACVVITAAILRFSLNIIHRSNEEALKLEERLLRGERLESLGRLAGGVAHDLNNLLTIILGNVDVALAEESGADDSALGEIRTAADRAASLTRRLLAFGRRQVYKPELIDIGVTVAAFEPLLRRLLPEDVTLVLERDAAPTPIIGDPAQLEQIVLNLVANARDALPGAGAIRVTTSLVAPAGFAREPELPPAAVWLVVSDDGAGMTPEARAHLFEPFFTTKAPDKGTGLGLATVHGIVAQCEGRILVASAPGKGTSIAIAFPHAPDGVRASSSPRVPRAAATPPATILLVEDDPAVRAVVSAMLVAASFHVLPAASSDEAESASDGYGGKIDLLLTDVVMQGGSGPHVARKLRGRRADMKILYVSGHAEELIATRGILLPGIHFLAKPFTRDALVAKVREVLASPGLGDVGL
ncbi:MAG TPA: ATP-binding protein [Polyangia bacterium]|nr:ATP-binding protein [Polyangia bacterium]